MKPIRLSLRWQVILLAALVLALLAGTFTWQQHTTLTEQFEQARQKTSERQVTLLGQLFVNQSAYLQNLAGMLGNLASLRNALGSKDAKALVTAFDPLWAELNLGSSLESVQFYTDDGTLLASWGGMDDAAEPQRLALRAGRKEEPAERLSCTHRCLHYTAVPLVEKGRFLGTLVFGSGLQDLILHFRQLAGAELAVLSPYASDARPHLPALGGYLVSVSGDTGHGDMLRSLRSAHQRDGEHQFERGGLDYRIRSFASPLGEDASFAVIEDVTAQVASIRSANLHNLAWGAAVLGIAMLLLYALLWPIMQRFRRVATVLPMLGQGLFSEVRGAFHARKHRFKDETDELGQAATDLADTLEHLNTLTQRHARQLADRADEIRRERDFISSLLDTAPALIVTHDAEGAIRLANAHAVQTTGTERSELQQKGFLDSFYTPEQRGETLGLLQTLREGDVRHSEGHFPGPEGKLQEVVWFHSLFEADAGRPTCLSVGLDVTAHKQAERRLTQLVDHDAVTGLYNRRAFQEELERLMAQPGCSGALLVCDIDEFRAINEASGHETGDAMLALFARQVTAHSPLPTLSARLGGDEFAFYYADMGTAEAIVAARQMNQALVGVGTSIGLPKRSFTSCVGIALSQDNDLHANGLTANAESALAQARDKGEGNWHLYAPNDPYQTNKGHRVYWSDEVERALAENRLVLHFQPILDLSTQSISHWESLIRLTKSDGSLVMPGQFMGVAEATGLVRHLDRWVVGEATRTLQHAFYPRDIHLALNLSGRSLDDEETFETLRDHLAQKRMTGERLILEITETAALADIKSAARLMARYRELGCLFSLDDFGVGYSSFQYLKELPVDYVKIDGSFIVGLKDNRDDRVFVKALTDAVHGFGKKVVAEFVEDGETLGILREYGVDYAQGYYIGRPSSKLSLAKAA